MSEKLYNPKLEQAVLSCVLIAPGTWAEMAVKPQHFHDSRHVVIAQAIETMFKHGAEIDLLTVSTELEKSNLLAQVGGSAYLTQLISGGTGSTLYALTYAEELKELAARRELFSTAQSLAKLAHDRKREFSAIATEAREYLDKSLNSGNAPQGKTLAQAASQYLDQIEARMGQDAPIGTSTGYMDIDAKLDGLRNGKLYLIAARPGAGKTAMLGNLAINAAKQNKRVLFFSVEMFSDEIVSRLLAAEINVNTRLLDHGNMEQGQWDTCYQTLEAFENFPFRIYSPNECHSVEKVDIITRQHYARGEVDLVFVDYLQLLQLENPPRSATREQEVAKIAQTLKRITHLNIPVIAAAQLSRAVEQRAEPKPQLSDLRESGALEQESDAVCFLWQPDKLQESSLEFFIAKNRGGAVGECPLYYDKRTQKIKTGIRETISL